jgi:biopolymer transport protein ExbD
MKIKRRVTKAARIEMLPLIDVVFLLLVFFIYAMVSMAVQYGLPLSLPVSSQASQTTPSPIAVSLQVEAGALRTYVNKTPVTLTTLGDAVREQMANGTKQQVLVYGEAGIDYQQIFSVLDVLQQHGIEKVSLQAARE